MIGFIIFAAGICLTAFIQRERLAAAHELLKDGIDLNNARKALINTKQSFVDAAKSRLEIVEKTGEIIWDINHIIHPDDKK